MTNVSLYFAVHHRCTRHNVYLENPQSFLHIGICDKRLQGHLCQALGDPDHSFQLPDGDGDGKPLLPLLLHLTAGVPHQDVAVFQFLGSLLSQPWATSSPIVIMLIFFIIVRAEPLIPNTFDKNGTIR